MLSQASVDLREPNMLNKVFVMKIKIIIIVVNKFDYDNHYQLPYNAVHSLG